MGWNDVITGDCLEVLAGLPAGSVDLAFADPPFNIGYEYDVYHDRRHAADYLVWTEKWLAAVNRVLKLSDGSYAVHMIKISWPHHVFVSKTFKVTGAIG